MQALDALLNRVSVPRLLEPAPTAEQREVLFAAAMRAPDHGQLRPWRFLTVEGAAREQMGTLLAEAARLQDPEAPQAVIAKAAARLCGVNLIAQMKAACDGDLDRVVRVVKLSGFVQAGANFLEIPQVVNGASDLMVEAFGDAGKHARSAVGVYRLPLGFSVEVDAVVQVR